MNLNSVFIVTIGWYSIKICALNNYRQQYLAAESSFGGDLNLSGIQSRWLLRFFGVDFIVIVYADSLADKRNIE